MATQATKPDSAARDAPSSSTAPFPPDPAAPGTDSASPLDQLRSLTGDFAELKEYATYYLAAKSDRIKLTLRSAALYAILGIAGLIAAAALIATAVVLLLAGLSNLINTLADSPRLTPWLGHLIVSIVLLALVALGAYLGIRRITGASRKRTLAKYQDRQRQQTINYGHNVHQRAQARQDEQHE